MNTRLTKEDQTMIKEAKGNKFLIQSYYKKVEYGRMK